MGYNWDFHMILAGYEWWWLKGLVVTIAYAAATVAGGLLIGVICGTGLLLNRWWLSAPIHVYVETFRCTPVLVQIVWFFFALPILLHAIVPGGGLELPGWLAAGIGLTLYMGYFATEIFRGASSPSTRGSGRPRGPSA